MSHTDPIDLLANIIDQELPAVSRARARAALTAIVARLDRAMFKRLAAQQTSPSPMVGEGQTDDGRQDERRAPGPSAVADEAPGGGEAVDTEGGTSSVAGEPVPAWVPVWERHAWELLVPCTDGWRCCKCLVRRSVTNATERCPGPSRSGPPSREARWGAARRPVWVFVWPDGQHVTEPADYDEHLQEQRYRELTSVRRSAGMTAPKRTPWLNRHLLAVGRGEP